jgi:hypothetical protein
VADQVVNVVFELGSPHLESLDFLIRGEVDFFFDAINLVVQTVILVEEVPEVIIRALEPPDDLAMFRKLSEYRMMKFHGSSLLLLWLIAGWVGSKGPRSGETGR